MKSSKIINNDKCNNKNGNVFNRFLCYALKQGELRIISKCSNDRILIKNHTSELVDMKFLCYEKPFLLLAGLDQKITLLDLSDEITEAKGKILLSIFINDKDLTKETEIVEGNEKKDEQQSVTTQLLQTPANTVVAPQSQQQIQPQQQVQQQQQMQPQQDEEEYRSPIKLAWGPISDLLFIFSYHNKIVFLNWSKILTINGGGDFNVSPDTTTDGDSFVR